MPIGGKFPLYCYNRWSMNLNCKPFLGPIASYYMHYHLLASISRTSKTKTKITNMVFALILWKDDAPFIMSTNNEVMSSWSQWEIYLWLGNKNTIQSVLIMSEQIEKKRLQQNSNDIIKLKLCMICNSKCDML